MEIIQENEDRLIRKIESANANDVNELEQILKNHEYNPDVPGDDSDTTGIENNFLKFHKQHYLILIVKWILINLYGRKSGYLNTQLSKTQLQNKRKYCHDYLKALNIVDAGISHNRGNIEDEF